MDLTELGDTDDLLADPADGSRIVCAALVRKGLLVGSPTWVDAFSGPVLVTHLRSKLPTRIDTDDWYRADPATDEPHPTAIGSALSTNGLVITNDHLDEDDHKARGTSDHGVVRVRFRWRPAKACPAPPGRRVRRGWVNAPLGWHDLAHTVALPRSE